MEHPTVRDADGREIREGAIVRVLALASGLTAGLPAPDAAFLESTVGSRREIDEIVDGEACVLLRRSKSRCHFIRSPGHLLRVVDEDA